MRTIIRLRQAAAKSPIGPIARRLGLHRAFDLMYEPLLRRRGSLTITVLGHAVRFLMENKLEANRILGATGEMDHIESICDEIRAEDVFWDIGANIGMFACSIGRIGGDDVRVEAFEPEPTTAVRLKENVALNKLTNVGVHRVALSDESGHMDFNVSGKVGMGTHSLYSEHLGDDAAGRRVRVDVRNPIDFAESEGLSGPTIVKCDVEGAEAGVLRGLAPWIESGRIRRLDIEFHLDTLERIGESAEELKRTILDAGYTVDGESKRGPTLNISFRRVE